MTNGKLRSLIEQLTTCSLAKFNMIAIFSVLFQVLQLYHDLGVCMQRGDRYKRLSGGEFVCVGVCV